MFCLATVFARYCKQVLYRCLTIAVFKARFIGTKGKKVTIDPVVCTRLFCDAQSIHLRCYIQNNSQ